MDTPGYYTDIVYNSFSINVNMINENTQIHILFFSTFNLTGPLHI